MSTFQPGDSVVVANRPQTTADVASHLYYPHYAGLTGTILKVYGEEAAVLVDRGSLPAAILTRHEHNEKHQRQRWLDSLSDEARNKLTSSEKQFALNYAILVSTKDLAAGEGSALVESPPRKTNEELAAAEAEHMASLQAG